ncbi:hypothetical protein FUAX_08340 [Fulvitalea axinellae]|uniref:Carboxypeptidase-like regulatory domain-containing protein n=1 Tax=Fulvitalea axinellae TaxID=1182444 RepID=A0AAU9CNB0_9BACT|nr:hypothetical protein FUAX_08340 [Fulvitalea axinellae]
MKKILFSVLAMLPVLLLSSRGMAQEQDFFGEPEQSDSTRVIVTGLVINGLNNAPMPYVHVINEHLKQGSTTADDGLFMMRMAPTDTLVFSFVGYKPLRFTLPQPVERDRYVAKIVMEETSYELQTLIIRPFIPIEDLKQQIINEKVEDPDKKEKVAGVKYGSGKKKSAMAYGSPISAIAYLFSKERKMKKKLAKAEEEYENFKIIDAKFNEKIVAELTGYTDNDRVLEFMRFCNYSNDYLVKTVAYDIIVDLQYKKEVFEAMEKTEKVTTGQEDGQ